MTLSRRPQAYLQLPTIFDEFSSWQHLPAVMDVFLGALIQYRHLKLLPLQFILQDSVQSHVLDTAGCQGRLYG